MALWLWIIGGLVLLVFLWAAASYNGLVGLRNQTQNAWSQIDVQLKRRHDLIPNLVESVKGYAGHEKSTLEGVIKARNQAASASGVLAQARAEGELSAALGRLMAVVEQYPDLKANQNFLRLQEELTSTENKVSFSRQFYNDSVMEYNTRLQSVPSNIIADLFRFQKAEFFGMDAAEDRAVPKVSFS